MKEIENGGRKILFGLYMQLLGNASAPIEWLVLKREPDKALLLSRHILDYAQYHRSCLDDFTWETSDIRNWLNEVFVCAFSPKEQKSIIPVSHGEKQDMVFLLDAEEVKRYVPGPARASTSTPYCWWWMRGQERGGENGAPAVDNQGCIIHGGISVESLEVGVRPAIWVSL